MGIEIPKNFKHHDDNLVDRKPCNVCGEIKLLKDYHNNKSCKLGVTGTCRLCEWIRRKEWYARNRKRRQDMANLRNQTRKKELVDQFGNQCLDCKQSFPQCVYEFHHLDPKGKDMNPSAAITMRKERRDKELAKCIMLCSNCHKIRHHASSNMIERLEEENDTA